MREVEADLHPVAGRGPDRRDRLRREHEQGDDDADDRLREAQRRDPGLDGRRLDLGQADHRDEGDDQQAEAGVRRAVGRRVGVAVLVEVDRLVLEGVAAPGRGHHR